MTATNNLAFLRTEKGLSQEKLAELLNVSRQTISRWESGETLPSADNLIRLSRALDVSVEDLMGNAPVEPKAAVATEERLEPAPQKDGGWRKPILIGVAIGLAIAVAIALIVAAFFAGYDRGVKDATPSYVVQTDILNEEDFEEPGDLLGW